MWRHAIRPRKDWEKTVIEQGLVFPHTVLADGSTIPYWHEEAWYEVTMPEVEALEAATEELWALCIDAAGYMASALTDQRLGLPSGSLDVVRDSIRRADQAVHARFDLAQTIGGAGPAKMLEINGDTPTGLVETGVIQWRWVEDVMPELDQWNSVHDRLVQRWRDLMRTGAVAGNEIHFLYDLGEGEHYDGGEMEMTVHYLMDCAMQAGARVMAQPIALVGWNEDERVFLDANGYPIRNAYKLYAWEEMLGEEFGRILVDQRETRPVRWFEPAWKMLLSTKAILPVLWERNPDHPLLLPAYFDAPGDLEEWVAKPLHGREGDNIVVHLADGTETTMPGGYGAEGWVYQQYTPLPSYDGNLVVLGSWIIDGEAAGMIVRESDSYVTDFYSRAVPHVISDALNPDVAQVQGWLTERTQTPRVPVVAS